MDSHGPVHVLEELGIRFDPRLTKALENSFVRRRTTFDSDHFVNVRVVLVGLVNALPEQKGFLFTG